MTLRNLKLRLCFTDMQHEVRMLTLFFWLVSFKYLNLLSRPCSNIMHSYHTGTVSSKTCLLHKLFWSLLCSGCETPCYNSEVSGLPSSMFCTLLQLLSPPKKYDCDAYMNFILFSLCLRHIGR